MSSYDRDLPFFPQYRIEVRGHVTVWWFNNDFSQSHYNYKQIPSGSNACTLITVLLASRFHYRKIKILKNFQHELPEEVISTFAECILDGNDIHTKLRKSGNLENINLTIPEAIEGAGKRLRNITEWKCVLYTTDLQETLYIHLKKHFKEWYSCPLYEEHPDLYIILIADQRSVFFIYQDDVDLITLMDSHQHLHHGALIAQVPRVRLKALCFWFCTMIQECFDSEPNCYELSFLYFRKEHKFSYLSNMDPRGR